MNRAVRFLRYVRFCLFDPARFGGAYAERERFTSSVFISPRRDFLYVKNEKAGSNTVRETLQRLAADRPLPAGFADANRWAAPLLMPSDIGLKRVEDLNDLIRFKFAVVRNPYTRLLSAWLNKFRPGDPKAAKFRRRLGASAPVGFADFVARVCAQAPDEMDPHWRLQTVNLYCGRLRYDRFVSFENFEAEFGEILMRLFGRADIFPVRKKAPPTDDLLAAHYAAALAAQIAEKFAPDFETFGYSRDLARALAPPAR